MKREEMVFYGFINKIHVVMSNILPDETVGGNIHKQQEPSDALSDHR
jgi:hypothetical protein